MTDREAMQMALEALEFNDPLIEDYGSKEQLNSHKKAIVALYKTLAQPEQESVAWLSSPDFIEQQTVEGRPRRVWFECNTGVGTPFYTAPPSKEWVSLTDEECDEIWGNCLGIWDCLKMTEAKLKEKNT